VRPGPQPYIKDLPSPTRKLSRYAVMTDLI
jgi:hypothetical protein